MHGSDGVTRTWYKEGPETKRKSFKGDTQKYYEIRAENSDKTIDMYTVSLDRQPHEVEC